MHKKSTKTLPVLAFGAAMVSAASAQTLPAPPVSPTPIVNYEYDAEGLPTKTIVAPSTRAYATQNQYDALGRVKQTKDAKSGLTDYGFDLLDQLTSITDPKRLNTQYKPTGLGDVEQLVSPDTGTANSTFDELGNLKTRTDARGVLATFTYDELNRPKQVVYSKSGTTSRTISWTYDQTGASFGSGVGRLTTAATPDASTTFRYDAQGRVTMTVQSASAGNALVVNFDYDDAGHVTKLTYPSGRVVDFGWANGRPQSVKITMGTTAKTVLDQVTLTPFGALQSWVWQFSGTAKAHARVFDTNGRLVRYPLGLLVRDVTYDDADRISNYTHYTAATAAAAPDYDQVFGYDELNRLTSVTGSISYGYTYDANGNRLTSQAGSTTRTFTVSAISNRVDGLANPARSWGYDTAGNTTSDAQAGSSSNYTATYSLEGRWAAMAQGSTAGVDFGYDAMGRRVTRGQWTGSSSNPRTYTLYAYDGSNHLIGEYDASGAPISEYVWLGDTPVAVVKSDAASPGGFAIYAIHTDHLDTPRVILDAQNQVRWRWLGEPFGNSPAEEQPTAGLTALQQNLRFPGQQYDPFGGRHYNYFRDYDPTIGRYVQSDPIGLNGGSMTTYGYVNGSPLMYTDRLGLANSGWKPSQNMFKGLEQNLPPPDRECMEELLAADLGRFSWLAGPTKEFSLLSLFPNNANIDNHFFESDIVTGAGIYGKMQVYGYLKAAPGTLARWGANGLHFFGEYVSAPLTFAATMENATVATRCSCAEKQDPGAWQRLREYRQSIRMDEPVYGPINGVYY
jgi:RHS repeat-associated protein